ncbi:hypothetical protein TD95_005258 [Thielaviopsis punctulata]|uniref:CBS domain-containing protein n=1 Tax=Thielaviopsis punctulata TaxID=72032 RepID=A0A0F4ZGN2_9PEZI|nr:hypothetical protein TD95_005258 [Thielaviopsis punctulata]
MASTSTSTPADAPSQFVSQWSSRYRGATVEDLDPPAALSMTPSDTVNSALIAAFEREYTHLTVIDGETRALLGYIAIPQLQQQLAAGKIAPTDSLSSAMVRFNRKARKYTVITMQTPLEQLEEFFLGGSEPQTFAVVTDEKRRLVLGVATVDDLKNFVARRPE